MGKLKLAILAVTAALALGAAAGAVYLRSSLPLIDGRISVNGLTGADIKITRDINGVPHILAANAEDAYFALGFAHAQDRLWQMETQRRIAAGRLAEIFGDAALPTDRLMRTLGIRRQSERTLAKLEEGTRRGLAAYAAGVNAFLAGRSGALPVEFLVFGITPEPWEPADSIAWGKMLAWDLSGNWGAELARFRLSRKLPTQRIAEFYPPHAGDVAQALPDLKALYHAALAAIPSAELAALAPHDGNEGIGSNNWLVGGALSATSKPLLANDPHLGLEAPSLWYLAHLKAPNFEIVGATLPGVPGVVLGHNRHVAWAFTNTGTDSQDLYLEKTDESGERYLTPDGWRPFVRRDEILRSKSGKDEVMVVRETRHGPVLDGAIGPASRPAKPYVITMAWTTLRDDDLTAQALLKLESVRNWNDFVSVMRDWHSPQQNMLLADSQGNIGFLAPGRVPVRAADNDLRGMAPAPGWEARYDWTGFIPYDALPRALNPTQGRLATANQKIVPRDYPHFITSEWAETYRATRIDALLDREPKHSIAGFRAMQADVFSQLAAEFVPLLLAAPASSTESSTARNLLAKWDFAAEGKRPEPLIFAAWYRELTRLIYADELGDEFPRLWRQRPGFMRNALTSQQHWCDDITTPETETCAAQIARALSLGLADLKRRYGDDMSKWRWADAHMARGRHRPFSLSGLFRPWFEISVPTPGDSYTVNVGRHDIANDADPFASDHGPSLRAIYDMADLDRSLFITSTGQSGNVFSPHYDDFADLWRRVDYIAIPTRGEDIAAGAKGTLVLERR
mgnify:CR=1 FL=1